MPDSHCFDNLSSATFTMLFTVALFNLLLFPAVLAVPSVLGARVVHRRTSGVFDKSLNWAGSILSRSNVRSTGCSAAAIDLIHVLFYITGEFQHGHRDVHRPHPIGFARGCCRRLGWYRRSHLCGCSSPDWCHFYDFFHWSTRVQW